MISSFGISWRHYWRYKVLTPIPEDWLDIPHRRRCVEISSYCDKNCRRRSVMKMRTDRERETHRQTDTSTDNKRHYIARENQFTGAYTHKQKWPCKTMRVGAGSMTKSERDWWYLWARSSSDTHHRQCRCHHCWRSQMKRDNSALLRQSQQPRPSSSDRPKGRLTDGLTIARHHKREREGEMWRAAAAAAVEMMIMRIVWQCRPTSTH